MLRQMAERDARDDREVQRRRELDAKNKVDANAALRAQMAEKQQRELNRQNDAMYADQVARRVLSIEDQERQAEL